MPIYLYIAMSLDGYIADKNHDIEWLNQTRISKNDSYEKFIKNMDITIMGKRTYDYVNSQVNNIQTLFTNTQNYVMTHHKKDIHPSFEVSDLAIIDLINTIDHDKRIWIIGGNGLIKDLLDNDYIDEMHIQIAPVLLGEGTPLFTQTSGIKRFQLIEVNHYDQLVELRYKKGELNEKNISRI